MQKRYDTYKSQVELALKGCFSKRGFPFDGLLESMEYSLMAGGKRIRPVLTMEFCRISGGDPDAALPIACAVEILHTYSLIHDDLPCMDNDDLRRGMPTNHVKFGEWQALLAGDALQAEAFGMVLHSGLSPERRIACAAELAEAAGVNGICGGQYLDLVGEGHVLTQEQLSELHKRKTGALLAAACRMGVSAAGGSQDLIKAADMYGAALGIAFQIRDDMLDEIGAVERLGKPIGSDKREGKTTYLSLYGMDRCQAMVDSITATAVEYAKVFPDSEFLQWIAEKLAKREA